MSNDQQFVMQDSYSYKPEDFFDVESLHTAEDTTKSSSNGETEYQDELESEPDEGEDDEEEPVDESVVEDMRKLESDFTGISKRFRLINRIGEGTFSTVYKAEDMLPGQGDANAWGQNEKDANPPRRRRLGHVESQQPSASSAQSKRKHYVAVKKIYVTSSPTRILNELELLYDLRGCRSVCPLITAFRYQDQVVAVLPHFPHSDFRVQYRTFLVADMRLYFQSLLSALNFVHKHKIIHRDIKPTNFLYNPAVKRGVLVDFGLAEREYPSAEPCLCVDTAASRGDRLRTSLWNLNHQKMATGYPKNDSRPSRRANRAGTRGFRAPEVLFKCTSQATKIDIWSVGVILLTMLGRRFPFFHSMDDVDALVEISSIFGTRRMKGAAALHGQIFESTIPTIGDKGYPWEKIVKWSSCVEDLTGSEKQGVRLLSRLMELDPSKRISAREAMRHEFFTLPDDDDLPWGGEATAVDREDAGNDDNDETAADDDAVDEVQLI